MEPMRPISPPLLKRRVAEDHGPSPKRRLVSVPSPFQLTKIRDTQAGNNVDTVTIQDLIGDAFISECWSFNFLFNVDWFMKQFDSSIRNSIDVTVMHGSWREEDTNRQRIAADLEDWQNVRAVKAYMPDPFGTHHTKMMVIFRTDETAQVVIMTANMIPGDWANMTQAVWRSPMLPIASGGACESSLTARIGSGARFKMDLINYLKAYGESKTGKLVSKLSKYDFSQIRAALVGSVPGNHPVEETPKPGQTVWGWQGLKEVLRSVPLPSGNNSQRPVVVMQVSSIATLGSTNTWIEKIFTSLSTSSAPSSRRPDFRIVFPTADEIRRSIGGYSSGGSIHTPSSTKPGVQKQLDYLGPKMCYWAGDGEEVPAAATAAPIREAGRRRAAPHIKTYIRFSDNTMQRVDWAMVTSANLSKQAWGSLPTASGEMKTSSFELGVVVWPDLFQEDKQSVVMVPTFKRDSPDEGLLKDGDGCKMIGLRMPYDLPLVRYQPGQVPWCNKVSHKELDWRGEAWGGYSDS